MKLLVSLSLFALFLPSIHAQTSTLANGPVVVSTVTPAGPTAPPVLTELQITKLKLFATQLQYADLEAKPVRQSITELQNEVRGQHPGYHLDLGTGTIIPDGAGLPDRPVEEKNTPIPVPRPNSTPAAPIARPAPPAMKTVTPPTPSAPAPKPAAPPATGDVVPTDATPKN